MQEVVRFAMVAGETCWGKRAGGDQGCQRATACLALLSAFYSWLSGCARLHKIVGVCK